MKYQINWIKNVNGNSIFIKINLDLDVVNATIDHFQKNQIGGKTFLVPKQCMMFYIEQLKVNQLIKLPKSFIFLPKQFVII